MATDKTFAEHLTDGRAAMERVLSELIEARSSFWLAEEKSKESANQIYLKKLIDFLSREIKNLEFEKTALLVARHDYENPRVVNDCLAFMLDDDKKLETDYIAEKSKA